MTLFLTGIFILIAGYFTYGKFIKWILSPDNRTTPAILNEDGVDFICLPHWKNMMIQLLNIAGIGPVIGVILGIKFGAIVFLLIPIGNIIGGATHDFLAGMMSLRKGGANLPKIIQNTLGTSFSWFFNVFMIFLLLLVVAVFINVPAELVDGFWENTRADFWAAVILIFIYYIIASLFPIDKIIGRLYPIFGLMLFFGTAMLLISLLWKAGHAETDFLVPTDNFIKNMFQNQPMSQPIIPCLFVTIACGIISGFHATQSPIIARTMKSEQEAYSSFYGMMVLEGIIAMVWAAGALAVYNLFPETLNMKAPVVLLEIIKYFLGNGLGTITILAVIILAITSGDTALRSLRLSLGEIFHISQKVAWKRILIILPLIICITILLTWSHQNAKSFGFLWNYFAWGNQVLAACTLLAGMAWLISLRKWWGIALIPAGFMSFIVLTYILWISPTHGGPLGFGLPYNLACGLGITGAVLLCGWAFHCGKKLRTVEDSKKLLPDNKNGIVTEKEISEIHR
ncbi:MAG: carbon starvation CstA family protein [Planctomycetia bacterium]|nr:carbon starvation CstA family protein [Planctomycetia bacterium]